MRPSFTTSGTSPFPMPWRSWSRIRFPGTTRQVSSQFFRSPGAPGGPGGPWARGAGDRIHRLILGTR